MMSITPTFLATAKCLTSVLLVTLAAMALMVSLTKPVPAQMLQNPAVRAAINACKTDRQRLCANIQPGGGRIMNCLAEHSGAVTPACRSALDEIRAAQGAAPLAKTQ